MPKPVRKSRWNPPVRRILVESVDEVPADQRISYRAWLIARGGRPMERALIRARQRYEKQIPQRQQANRLHRAYSRKKWGWK